jgi:tetratricopeptide (TPR) repeat protein
LFRELATAAGSCDFDEVELRYWELAIAATLTDPANLRGLAQALTRQGRFEAATAVWQKISNVLPNDSEAIAALADLDSAAERQFSEQERALADAQAAGGPLLAILNQREDLQLARAQHRLEKIARRRAANDPHPKAIALVERLAAEHDRLEIEILHVRCERLPGDWQVRLELGRRLKRARTYSGALQRLEEAARLQPGHPAVLIEQGECWQHLRQFAKALEHYTQAAGAAGEERKLALYRAGVLASAMNQRDDARQYLEQLVALAPDFLDARQRLDNLQGS